jgi:hypothetical protein
MVVSTIDRLIAEALEIIPNLTSAGGSFSTMPPGYKARYPDEWQREVLETMDVRYLTAFKPDTNDILRLVELVNYWTLATPISQAYQRHDSSWVLLPIETITTIVSYTLFENLIRRLTPVLDGEGHLTEEVQAVGKVGDRVSSLERLLVVFERKTHFQALACDFRGLNERLHHTEAGKAGIPKAYNLYGRLQRGRNLLLHGNIMHSFEGWLLVLLTDLIVLHVMRQQTAQQDGVAP